MGTGTDLQTNTETDTETERGKSGEGTETGEQLHLEVLHQAPAGDLVAIDLLLRHIVGVQKIGNQCAQMDLELSSHIWQAGIS